jgi:predicted DNA-binding protein YlxM (UPF0122 family)
MIFTEVKLFTESTVRYSMERMVVLLNDVGRNDLAVQMSMQYEWIHDAMNKAENAKVNHEFQLAMLSAIKETKGLLQIVKIIIDNQYIPVIEEDVESFHQLVAHIDDVRRTTKIKSFLNTTL